MKRYEAKIEDEQRMILGEGPCYDPERDILSWVDIKTGTLYRKERQGTKTAFQTGQYLGAALPAKSGKYIGVLTTGLYLIGVTTMRRIYRLDEFQDDQRANDAKCDPQGRLWFGSIPLFDVNAEKGGNLYVYTPQDGVKCMVEGVGLSNGMAWNRRRKTMYYIDSKRHSVDAFSYHAENGTIGERRVVKELENGVPDGMTIDAEGMLWVAVWGTGRVVRIDPERGEVVSTVEVPAKNVTSCCFGSPSMDRLFITSSGEGLAGREDGCLFSAQVDAVGIPEYKFGDSCRQEGQ